MPKVLTNDDKGKQFFIDLGDGSGDEGVLVVPQSDSEKAALRKKFTKKTVTRNGMAEDFDFTAYYYARLKAVIKGWKKFTDRKGAEIPCTPENIVMCADMNSLLFIEILEKTDKLAEEGREVTEKN
jgi:hypothetical protein